MTAPAPEFPPKSEFRKWLRSLEPTARVAEDWSCQDCPLSMWLMGSGITEEPFIRPEDATLQSAWRFGTGPLASLPGWANEFAKKIDLLGARKSTDGYGPVTAADCLRVLARTPRA